MKWVLLGLVGIIGCSLSCHRYAIPDHEVAVQVETISLPPQWSAGESELTRSLVQMLQSRGFDSTWGASSGESPKRVVCALDIEEWRAEEVAFARASSICNIGTNEVRAVGRSQGHSDISNAIYEAGHNALAQALPEIESALGVKQ